MAAPPGSEERRLASKAWQKESLKRKRKEVNQRLLSTAKRVSRGMHVSCWRASDGSRLIHPEAQEARIAEECAARFSDAGETKERVEARLADLDREFEELLRSGCKPALIRLADVLFAIASLSPNTAGGEDGVVAEMLRHAPWCLKALLVKVFNERLLSPSYPQ